jgi:hypothetical protein
MPTAQQQTITDLKSILENSESFSNGLQSLIEFLPYSEYDLITFMNEQGVWQGTLPPPPVGWAAGEGSIDLGLFMYWLHNPQYLDLSGFSIPTRVAILLVIIVLQPKLAPTLMTYENYAYFQNNELIYTDGSVLSMKPFADYDQGWFFAFLNLVVTLTESLWYAGDQFPTTQPPVIPLKGAQQNSVTIGILGDAGSGTSTYQSILQALTNTNPKPDYLIHVGDVYYAGTPCSTSQYGSKYFVPNEEIDNFLRYWPEQYHGASFTLNSNHEMYSGANGYFGDLLNASNGGAGSPFSAQQGSSCFALQYGGWTILGLDSAYMGTSADAFMNGSIGGATGTQGKWISGLGLVPLTTIVLTHHNGFDYDCSGPLTLWQEINGAMEGDPYAWYWGHVHNGIAYDSPITIPAGNGQSGFTTNTFARCLGHASLPYGNSPALDGKPIAWRATNTQSASSTQLANGFATLTLTKDDSGNLSSIIESYYDLSSGAQPAYTKRIF